ncbi:hypothetical protein [Nonomuraea aridisoli]|nr:hypothetical protein [Nonomuraea aridisoli]
MALALTGAVAGVMFLPLGQAVAGASTGFPAVEAGGPPPRPKAAPRPAAPARPRVITHVRKEKPILVMPKRRHHHREHRNIDAIIDNFNFNDGRKREARHHRHHRHQHHHHPFFGPNMVEPEDELVPEEEAELIDGLN